ncbi:MAG: DUF1013 domain-containing protein [Hyphomicrobiaceae bacterium]|nr:DUF1013 domain-containing protein [Hyphomicrobiaceae bacterium]MCC0010400.1 DUF1013 domain-containing protein [Hyphomicrobiaceae bacterium]
MSDRKPLMPKATAVWLVDNTSLTFNQIAEFCDLHVLEVKGIADGDVAQGIRGLDPISRGQITRAEIERGEKDSSHKLRVAEAGVKIPEVRRKRYTPVSLRQEKPNAVLWLLRNHPELKDSQIIRLIGTTKQTIGQIRDRSHWNSPNLQPNDPVTLGICTQVDLDAEVKKAARRLERERKLSGEPEEKSESLLPTEQTTAAMPTAEILSRETHQHTESEAEEEARVFARLKQMSGPKDDDNEDDEGAQTEPATASDAVDALSQDTDVTEEPTDESGGVETGAVQQSDDETGEEKEGTDTSASETSTADTDPEKREG